MPSWEEMWKKLLEEYSSILFKLPSDDAKLLEDGGVYYYKEIKDMSYEELKKFNKEDKGA